MIFLFVLVSISSTPSQAVQLAPIEIAASASALSAGASYYAKIRLGNALTALTKGQTFHAGNDAPDDWLSDTDSYTLFPQITADAQGNWQGTLIGRATEGSTPGDNLVLLRLRKTDGTTNYDSQTVALRIDPAPTPTPAPTLTPTLAPSATSAPTSTAAPTASPIPTKTPTPAKTPTAAGGTKAPHVQSASLHEKAATQASSLPLVLGESAASSPSSRHTPSKGLAAAFAMVGVGLGILSAVFVWKKKGAILFP